MMKNDTFVDMLYYYAFVKNNYEREFSCILIGILLIVITCAMLYYYAFVKNNYERELE